MRLAFSVIWILTNNNHPHLLKRGVVKGIEDKRHRRVNNLILGFLLRQKLSQTLHIRLIKLITDHGLPRWMECTGICHKYYCLGNRNVLPIPHKQSVHHWRTYSESTNSLNKLSQWFHMWE